MTSIRDRWLRESLWTLAALCLAISARAENIAEPAYWNVDEVKAGMTGYGITVLKGTQTERFLVEVIGVLKSYSPGRDMILVRVAGLGLEKTGVMSGMSGSPVYLNEKLLGAIAFTWPFGKEPIGGITPFSQMVEYSKQAKSKDDWISDNRQLLLDGPLVVAGGSSVGSLEPISVPASTHVPDAWGGQMVRLRTPLATSSMSPSAIEELARLLGPMGMVPVQGGAAADQVIADHMNAKIEPGGAMAVGLVTGDVSMSAIGTVTAVTGDRVHGFGHPFFGSGVCELPLQTAYIHTVIPRQTVSSKMGSAISTVGKVDADVSTCVAGWLGKSADMVPLTVHVRSNLSSLDKVFQCEVVRDRLLLPPLTMSVLGSCADMEGQAPIDLTVKMRATVELEGFEPLVMEDIYSGAQYAGGRGLLRVFAPLANMLNILANNAFQRPRITAVTCETEIADRDQSARLLLARVEHPILEPGETLKVIAELQPVNRPGARPNETGNRFVERQKIAVELPIPKSIPPGKYTATIGSAIDDFRGEVTTRRHLANPTDFNQLQAFLRLQLSLRRNDLVLRFNAPTSGVAIDGAELPNLPGGVLDILADDTTGKISSLQDSLVSRKRTDWVVEGLQTVRFEVVKEKEFYK